MNNILKIKQNTKPYWVRFRHFRCTHEELDDYYNQISHNPYFIIFGYGPFRYTEEGVSIPVYYLEKADLTDENPYIQCEDWQSHPWDAPADAVKWV